MRENFGKSLILLEQLWRRRRRTRLFFWQQLMLDHGPTQHIGARMTIAGCGWKLLFARLRVSLPYRMTIALASENGDSWQCEWTQSHKNKNLLVKIATHGIANKLNRMMSTIACLECHRNRNWDVLYMRLRARTLLSRYWCGVCDWNVQSSETALCWNGSTTSYATECRKLLLEVVVLLHSIAPRVFLKEVFSVLFCSTSTCLICTVWQRSTTVPSVHLQTTWLSTTLTPQQSKPQKLSVPLWTS